MTLSGFSIANTPALWVPAEQPRIFILVTPLNRVIVAHRCRDIGGCGMRIRPIFVGLVGTAVAVEVNRPDVIAILGKKIHQRIVANLQVKKRATRPRASMNEECDLAVVRESALQSCFVFFPEVNSEAISHHVVIFAVNGVGASPLRPEMYPGRRRRRRARLRMRPRPKPETRKYVALFAVSLHSSAWIILLHDYGMYEKSSGSGCGTRYLEEPGRLGMNDGLAARGKEDGHLFQATPSNGAG